MMQAYFFFFSQKILLLFAIIQNEEMETPQILMSLESSL